MNRFEFDFEIDETKGFDVIEGRGDRIIDHFESYEEAVSRQRGLDNVYIRYYEKKPAERSEEVSRKITHKAA